MLRRRFSLTALFPILIASGLARGADAGPDEVAIRKTALDYIEGWYTGDAARMQRALHPDLAKRIVRTDASGKSTLNHQTAEILVGNTGRGGGKRTPVERQQKDITILDRFNNAAVVKVVASDWVDYLQVAKFNGEWKIINVLWEMKASGGN